jgi:hypothetical protein
MAEYPERWNVGGLQNRTVGPDIASAATVAPVHRVTYITGTAEIATVTLPWADFSGDLILIPDGAFTTTTTGNIITAVTAVANRPLVFVYHPGKAKWYIHAVA